MKRREFVHRGRIAASGLLIDAALLGEDEAQRRAVGVLERGDLIRLVGPDRLLVTFDQPRSVEAQTAPGMALVDRSGRLIGAPGLGGGTGDLAFWSGGEAKIIPVGTLPVLDPSAWLDVQSIPIEVLRPITEPVKRSPEDPPAPAALDLRRLAHAPARSPESETIADELRRGLAGRGIGWGASLARGFGGGRPGRPSAVGSLFARLVMRSPLVGEVNRRHARYLERLSEEFRRGELSEALRNAIPIGGLSGAALTLRLPQRRSDLRILFGRTAGATNAALSGPNVYEFLRRTYTDAAERLEQAGRIDEAAFVYAELLNSAQECVALLERHRRFDLAARIAEDRSLDPTLVIRLWWLAGERRNAVAVARRRNAFAMAINKLAATDPDAGRELRLEWVRTLEAAGDLVGAVSAGWRDPQVRHLLSQTVKRGVDLGGPAGASMLAYWLALDSSDEVADRVRGFLASLTPELWPELRAFLVALGESRGEPAVDREISSEALRCMLRSGRRDSDQTAARLFRMLRDRVDPALAADLPPAAARQRPAGPIECPDLPPGLMRILDAAPLPGGQTLLGLGEAGCRLIGPDGRALAHWDTPAHRLTVADHGGSALLISPRDELATIHVLDLTTRRIRYYGAIRTEMWADTFDGSTWPVARGGLSFYDILTPEPHVIWREFDPTVEILRLSRDAETISAFVARVDHVGSPSFEVWTWEQPGMRLLRRPPVQPPGRPKELFLFPHGWMLWTSKDGPPILFGRMEPQSAPSLGDANLIASQGYLGAVRLMSPSAAELSVLADPAGPLVSLSARLSLDGLGFRAVSDRVAAWDGTGRLFTADLEAGRLITATRLTA